MVHQADKKEYNIKDETTVTDMLKQGLRYNDEQGAPLLKYQMGQWFPFLNARHADWVREYPSL